MKEVRYQHHIVLKNTTSTPSKFMVNKKGLLIDGEGNVCD
jgi:hypothetical protein